MIYHFYNGNLDHIVPQNITNILTHSFETNIGGINEHFFYISSYKKNFISGNKQLGLSQYKEIFQRFKTTNYLFVEKPMNFLRLIKKSDDIYIFHNSLVPHYIQFLILLKVKFLKIKKVILICWGEKDFITHPFFKKHLKLHRYLFRWLYNSLSHIIVLSEGDYEVCSALYNKAKVAVELLPYFSSYTPNRQFNSNKCLRIMVSHSGWETNHHIEVFHLLEKFKDENIIITCPLCYGNAEYIEKVIQEGIRIFGTKFEYFTELKSKEAYKDYISKNNIFVAGAEIQTGLFALKYSMICGLKIYATGNLYDSFKLNGFVIQNINDLEKENFSSLSSQLDDISYQKNLDLFNKVFSQKDLAVKWGKLYTA